MPRSVLHKAYVPSGLVGYINPGVAFFLSSIGWQTAIKKFKDHRGYVSLKLAFLRSVIGRNAAKVAIETSLNKEYVRKDGSWTAGEQSMGYRIEQPWRGQRVEAFELPEEMSCRILSWQSRQIREAIAGNPARQHVFNSLEALSFRNGIKAVLAGHANDMDRLNTRIQAVGRIEDRNWWFATDAKSGRIYHNASSLPTDCRSMLLVDGQPAAETDITNCQPFLLAALYPGHSPERTRFMDLCVAGRFYEHLNGLFDVPYSDRAALKVATYQNIMYGRLWHCDQPLFKAFAAEWPILGGIIRSRKSGKGGRSRLPVEMQAAEAGLMIGRIVPRLMAELPGVPILTIHDSLLVGGRYADTAAAIITDEMRLRFGACPPVTIKQHKSTTKAT